MASVLELLLRFKREGQEVLQQAQKEVADLGNTAAEAAVKVEALEAAQATAATTTATAGASTGSFLSTLATAAPIALPAIGVMAQLTYAIGQMANEANNAAHESGSFFDGLKASALELGAFLAGGPFGEFIAKKDEYASAISDAWDATKILAEEVRGDLADALQTGSDATAASSESTATAGQIWNAFADAVRGAAGALPQVGAAVKDAAGNFELAAGPMEEFLGKWFVHPQDLQGALAVQDAFFKMGTASTESQKRIKAWEDEIYALQNAGGLPGLKRDIDAGVLSAKELSAIYGVSTDAIAYYKKGLRDTTAAQKDFKDAQRDAQKAADDLNKSQDHVTTALQHAGVVTDATINKSLAPLIEQLNLAAQAGDGQLRVALVHLTPEVQKLDQQLQAAGHDTSVVNGVFSQFADMAGLATDKLAGLEHAIPVKAFADGLGAQQQYSAQTEITTAQQDELTGAFKRFGLDSRSELEHTKEQAIADYHALAASGQLSTEQLKVAHQKMVDAINAASGTVPSYWQSTVVPGVKNTLGQLQTAVSGTFAQMILGAKGFGDGMKDIWESIKAAALNVFAEIADGFVKGLIGKLLGALTGSKSSITGGFGGILSSVFGLGAGAATDAAGSTAGLILGSGGGTVALGVPGAAGGAGGLGALGGALGGGLAAGGAGLGLGLLGQKIFGGAGAGAATVGGLGGAGTGALLGTTIFPGIGTAIGALIGGLSGVFGGLFGKSQGEKTNDTRDQFIGQFGGQGTGVGSGFANLAAQLTAITGEPGGGSLFSRLISAKDEKTLEDAIGRVNDALKQTKKGSDDASTAASKAADAERKKFAEISDGIKGKIADLDKQLADIDANEKPEQVMGVIEAEARAKIAAAKADLNQQLDDVNKAAQAAEDAAAKSGAAIVGSASTGIAGLSKAISILPSTAATAAGRISSTLGNIKIPPITIPFTADYPDDMPGGPESHGGGKIPGAANGVFATAPTFRVFAEREPELGGPVKFMSKALAGAIDSLGLPSGGGDTHVNVQIGNRALDDYMVSVVQRAVATGRIAIPTSSLRPVVSGRG